MTTLRLVAATAAVLLGLGLIAAACGGDGGESTGGGGGTGGDAAAGEELYTKTCSSCHGTDATGLPNLGKDLTASAFLKGLSDQEAVAFVTKGRSTDDPKNTTGVAMPPKGGNPALSQEDLENIVAYLRTLEK